MIIWRFMINVVSPNNTRLALVRKLSDKKYRDRYGLFVAEGEKLVKDAFRHGLKAEFVLCSRAYAEKREAGEQSFLSAPCFVADDRIFGKLCDTVTNQGVLAVVRREKKELSSPEGKCLLLDGLQDPANVGAVLRTAAAMPSGATQEVKRTAFSPRPERLTGALVLVRPSRRPMSSWPGAPAGVPRAESTAEQNL